MKTILITGGNGYLGSVLIKKLLKRGYKVVNLDSMIFNNTPLRLKKNKLLNFVGVTEDRYLLNEIFKYKIYGVIHLSGVSNDPTAILNSKLTRKSNINGTKLLVEISKKNNVKKFLFASSCSVYGFTGTNKFVDEKSALNPISEYAKSKISGEKIVLKYKSKKFIVNCLRKGTLYGPSPRMRFDLVLNTMTGSAIQDKKIILNGGDQWRPFLHVDDAASAYIAILENDKINGEVFNVGNNEQNFKIKDLAKIVKKLIPNTRILQSNNPDKRSYKVNFDKITNVIGWKTTKRLEDGIVSIKNLFKSSKIKNYKDINYYNIKRLMSHLNI